MRSFVFTNEALTRQAGRFVWLSIDTESAAGAAFLVKFPVDALPTFFVIDPTTEKAVIRWVGGATVAEIEKLLDEGERAVRRRGNGSDEILTKADQLFAGGNYVEAAAEYRRAIDSAPADWPPRARATASLLYALASSDDYAACAGIARSSISRLAGSPALAVAAATGLDCALSLPAESLGRKELIGEFEAHCRSVLADKNLLIAADDRAGIYAALISAREDAGDKDGTLRVAEECAAYLESQAAAAKTPEQRAVFDSFRLNAYLTLGHPERAVPMLQASERDLPEDYNPSARLALAYKEMGNYVEAIAASNRALAKVYGPRTLRVLLNLSDIYTAKGDAASARKTLEEALRYAESLPEGQRSGRTIAAIKKRIEAPGR